MKDLLGLPFIAHNGKIEKREGKALFTLSQSDGREREAAFSADISGELSGELILSYSLLGLYRGITYRRPFVYLIGESGEITPLLYGDDINTDGRRYTVRARIPKGRYSRLTLHLSVDRAKLVELMVYSFFIAERDELSPSLSESEAEVKSGISPICVDSLLNGVYDPLLNDTGMGSLAPFKSESISPFGIPFRVKCEGNNAVIPTPAPKENEDIIESFGVTTKRGLTRPVSRDSKTEVKIGRCVSEIYFILAMQGERRQRYTFATKGNILGVGGGEVMMPLSIDDTTGFFVEILYKNGKRDTALPKNLTEGRFSVSGDISVYAVASDFSEVESIVFHNKKLKTDLLLMAVSVNLTENRYFKDLLIPEYKKKIEKSVKRGKSITLKDNEVLIENGGLRAVLDVSDTLGLCSLESGYADGLRASSSSLVRLKREGDETLLVPRVKSVRCDSEALFLTLECEEFSIDIAISNSEPERLVTNVNVKNDSQNERKIAVFFPVIENVTSTSDEDLFYFVPKYQNLNSNETIVVNEESSPSFPMQFMTLYSKESDEGIGLLTRERDTVVRIYRLEKRAGVASMCVEYPEMYGKIGAGEVFSLSETVVEARRGSFKATMASYTEWLSSWYKPYKCQNKKWYRQCFWLLAEITDFFEDYSIARFPIWHELNKPSFNFLSILEEQKSLSGAYPDILHMWHWTVRYDENGRKRAKWGNWGGEDYDIYGGLEPFRAALDEFQREKGVYASIYMHPTLFASSYPHFKKYEHLKVVNENGDFIRLADSFRMCHANSEWRQYALDQYPRVYSELGVPILYVDEFSLRIENRCYAEHHGHEVPSNLLKTDREFITRLKDTVPEELVLYGEYAAVDINAGYIDCNITYGILDSITDMIERSWRGADSDEPLSRVLTDAYRFAFPKIVQLVLPMALRNLSWHPHKFIFWNGEAEYDSFWDLLESDGNEFTMKAYSIKKKYADCFSSDEPEMLIPSLSPALAINKFPSENREIYTVYNRAYRTYRGAAIELPYKEGVRYIDVWNEREADFKVNGEVATVFIEIDAQGIGCILREDG